MGWVFRLHFKQQGSSCLGDCEALSPLTACAPLIADSNGGPIRGFCSIDSEASPLCRISSLTCRFAICRAPSQPHIPVLLCKDLLKLLHVEAGRCASLAILTRLRQFGISFGSSPFWQRRDGRSSFCLSSAASMLFPAKPWCCCCLVQSSCWRHLFCRAPPRPRLWQPSVYIWYCFPDLTTGGIRFLQSNSTAPPGRR